MVLRLLEHTVQGLIARNRHLDALKLLSLTVPVVDKIFDDTLVMESSPAREALRRLHSLYNEILEWDNKHHSP